MNEVRLAQPAVHAAQASSSSKGDVNASEEIKPLSASDKAETTEAEQAPKAPNPADLKQQVAKVNDYVQSVQRDLQFSVDEDLDRTVIKVIDSDSGDVIRQIPEDIFLEIARRLQQDGEVHLLNALG
ncbi:flagellar protein FlaG [Agaribacterium sp. ZY112]|uniref:flagellar protein FlaG n=1 Tax=Agaribacterium sp. ZY112 TaxID=3233574 RepID=UPI0035265D58